MDLEQEIVSRIEQYIPDLRKQVKMQMIKQFHKTNKQMLQDRTDQIREMYTNKLKQKANEIKENISANLMSLHKEIAVVQLQINEIKTKKLTEDDKRELIQQTVDQIVSDTQMLQQIKVKLYPKVQQDVLAKLQSNLQTQLEQFQRQQQEEIENMRKQWQEERYQHWRAQSERDLEVLAEQHKELQCKKSLIHQSYASKKAQRDGLLRQQNSYTQVNNEIAYLKNQIKLLS